MMNRERIIEIDLFGTFLIILFCNGNVKYARSMLLKRIVIIGWMSLNNKNKAIANNRKGTIF